MEVIIQSSPELQLEVRGLSDLDIEFSTKVTYVEGNYKSSISYKGMPMPYDVGGIPAGTTVAELDGRSKDAILDDLLFPTVNPTFIAPSASLALKDYPAIVEVGTQAPSVASFATGFDSGAIMILDSKQNDRAGALDVSQSFIYADADHAMPPIVPEGNTEYRYRAVYAEGPLPKDNKGNDFGTPLPAGSVDSPKIIVNGTYPWYASTTAATSENPVVKQSLVAWNATAGSMSTGNFTLQPSGTLPQVFLLPRQIKSLRMLNTISNQMEAVSLDTYAETEEQVNGRRYYRYTYSGAARGMVTLRATF